LTDRQNKRAALAKLNPGTIAPRPVRVQADNVPTEAPLRLRTGRPFPRAWRFPRAHGCPYFLPRTLAAAAICSLLVASPVLAQITGLPNIAPPKAEGPKSAEASETSEQARARIRKLIDEARAQSERPPQPLPAGIGPREVAELREAQLKLVVVDEIHLRTLDQLDQGRSARQAAEARDRDWTGFETAPPYSIYSSSTNCATTTTLGAVALRYSSPP
jgi:hypothetical protein